MENLLSNKCIRDFLHHFSDPQWERVIKAVCIYGIQSMEENYSIERMSVVDLENLVVNKEREDQQRRSENLESELVSIKSHLRQLDESLKVMHPTREVLSPLQPTQVNIQNSNDLQEIRKSALQTNKGPKGKKEISPTISTSVQRLKKVMGVKAKPVDKANQANLIKGTPPYAVLAPTRNRFKGRQVEESVEKAVEKAKAPRSTSAPPRRVYGVQKPSSEWRKMERSGYNHIRPTALIDEGFLEIEESKRSKSLKKMIYPKWWGDAEYKELGPVVQRKRGRAQKDSLDRRMDLDLQRQNEQRYPGYLGEDFQYPQYPEPSEYSESGNISQSLKFKEMRSLHKQRKRDEREPVVLSYPTRDFGGGRDEGNIYQGPYGRGRTRSSSQEYRSRIGMDRTIDTTGISYLDRESTHKYGGTYHRPSLRGSPQLPISQPHIPKHHSAKTSKPLTHLRKGKLTQWKSTGSVKPMPQYLKNVKSKIRSSVNKDKSFFAATGQKPHYDTGDDLSGSWQGSLQTRKNMINDQIEREREIRKNTVMQREEWNHPYYEEEGRRIAAITGITGITGTESQDPYSQDPYNSQIERPTPEDRKGSSGYQSWQHPPMGSYSSYDSTLRSKDQVGRPGMLEIADGILNSTIINQFSDDKRSSQEVESIQDYESRRKDPLHRSLGLIPEESKTSHLETSERADREGQTGSWRKGPVHVEDHKELTLHNIPTDHLARGEEEDLRPMNPNRMKGPYGEWVGSYPKDPKDKSLFELANSNNYTYPYLLRESESQAVSKPEDREERKISPRIPHPHHTNQSSMNMKSATSLTSSSVFTASKNSHPWAPDRHDHHEVLQSTSSFPEGRLSSDSKATFNFEKKGGLRGDLFENKWEYSEDIKGVRKEKREEPQIYKSVPHGFDYGAGDYSPSSSMTSNSQIQGSENAKPSGTTPKYNYLWSRTDSSEDNLSFAKYDKYEHWQGFTRDNKGQIKLGSDPKTAQGTAHEIRGNDNLPKPQ